MIQQWEGSWFIDNDQREPREIPKYSGVAASNGAVRQLASEADETDRQLIHRTCRQLESTAWELETAGKFDQADRVRALADEMRREAREAYLRQKPAEK